MTLARLDGLRDQHESLQHNLLTAECYVDTELMQMELRTPRYSPYRYPEREKLHRRLLSIEQQKTQLALRESVQLGELHDRLLYLLNEHTRLMRRWTSKNSPGNWNR